MAHFCGSARRINYEREHADTIYRSLVLVQRTSSSPFFRWFRDANVRAQTLFVSWACLRARTTLLCEHAAQQICLDLRERQRYHTRINSGLALIELIS